jgi:hypothetical protein
MPQTEVAVPHLGLRRGCLVDNAVEKRPGSDWKIAIIVCLMLLLTAWGNAYSMLLVGGIGLAIGLVFFRKTTARRGVLVAFVACFLAISLAIIMLFR